MSSASGPPPGKPREQHTHAIREGQNAACSRKQPGTTTGDSCHQIRGMQDIMKHHPKNQGSQKSKSQQQRCRRNRAASDHCERDNRRQNDDKDNVDDLPRCVRNHSQMMSGGMKPDRQQMQAGCQHDQAPGRIWKIAGRLGICRGGLRYHRHLPHNLQHPGFCVPRSAAGASKKVPVPPANRSESVGRLPMWHQCPCGFRHHDRQRLSLP